MGIFDFLDKLPNLNEIKGSFGEVLTKYFAKLSTDAIILHDILIDGDGESTSQIDLIMIAEIGIYVVEVKNYMDARIYGDGKKSTWYCYRGGQKYNFYSPLKQNKKHIQYLKSFLTDYGEIPYYSLITMLCADCKITNINEDPENKDTAIATSLLAMLEGYKFFSKGKTAVLSEEQRQEIAEYIQNNQHQGKDARVAHKERVQEIKAQQEERKNQKICPYCKSELVLRKGKYGTFYGCSNYPKCKYTQKVSDHEEV